MKTLKFGVMPYESYKQRVLDIAAGRYKPLPSEPKIWFKSLSPLVKVLNEDNMKLLLLIVKMKPASIKDLAELSGRKSRTLSRTLKRFERYGIVELKKENRSFKPIVKAINFQIEYKSV